MTDKQTLSDKMQEAGHIYSVPVEDVKQFIEEYLEELKDCHSIAEAQRKLKEKAGDKLVEKN